MDMQIVGLVLDLLILVVVYRIHRSNTREKSPLKVFEDTLIGHGTEIAKLNHRVDQLTHMLNRKEMK